MLGLLLLSVFPAALIIAALTDIYDFKIPNWVSLTLFLSFAPTAFALDAPMAFILEGLMLGAAVLAVGFFLFAVKFFGAGDAKLFAAVAPWIGLINFAPFLFSTVFVGGGVAIFLITFRRFPILPIYAHAPFLIRMHQNTHELPYAVAIAGGGLITFSQTPLFKMAFGG